MNRHKPDADPEGLSRAPRGSSINSPLRESEPGFFAAPRGLKCRNHVVKRVTHKKREKVFTVILAGIPNVTSLMYVFDRGKRVCVEAGPGAGLT